MGTNRGGGSVPDRSRTARTVPGHTRTSVLRSIRVRMMLPILVATAGVVVLGLLRTTDAISTGAATSRAQSLATASDQLVTMVHLVSREFVETNYTLRNHAPWTTLDDEIALTDSGARNATEAIATIRAALPDLGALCDAVEGSLANLTFARSVARTLQDGASTLLAYYDVSMQSLLALADAIPAHMSDTHLVELAQALALVGHLDRLAALQWDLIDRSLQNKVLGVTDALALPEWAGEERTRVDTLKNLSVAGARYSEYLRTKEISNAASIRQNIINSRGSADLNNIGAVWLLGQSARIDALGTLRDLFARQLIADAAAQGRAARDEMLLTAAITGLLVALTLVTATGLAFRTSRRLRRTREVALAAARVELPNAISNVIASRDETMVRHALSTSSARVDAMLTPEPDEIGELASAFGAVHRQALRLAADQALLRMEVQAMFVALSRRGQTLVQRQIQLIDEFGRDEADPDALAQLFLLDHLAARMRRNEENLLVLAGGEPGRWITQPVAMADLLRAAAQEIEEYRRVEITFAPEVAVSADVAGDAIHLLAELMENATMFSPPGSSVRVFASRDADGMTIKVEDSGIGMPADKLDEANYHLQHPSALTSNLVGTMGLLVVSRLAERHKIMVRLDSRPAVGTTATVVLPDRVLGPITPGVQRDRFARELVKAGRDVPVPAAAVTSLPPAVEAPSPPRHSQPVPAVPQQRTPSRQPAAPIKPMPTAPVRVSVPAAPVSGVPVSGVPVSGVPVSGVPVSGVPVSGVPVSAAPAPAVLAAALPPLAAPFTAPPAPYLAPPLPNDTALETTSAGLPRRPALDRADLDLADRPSLPEASVPDPDAVRARLSSLSQGIAAGSHSASVHPPTSR